MAIFENPAWLLIFPPLLLLLGVLGRARTGAAPDRRRRLRFIFRATGLTALTLALAGLRFPVSRARIDVVAAVDLSDSIYDRAAQETSLRQLAVRLKDAGARLGVVTFGGDAVTERPPLPLPDSSVPASGDLPTLPDLRRAKVSGTETDIGGALDRARGLLDPASSGRAIVLLSDGHDTVGEADERAAALRGSGIDLLIWPATLGGNDDVVLAGLHLPERAEYGRDAAITVTVAAQRATRVRVRLGRKVPQGIEPVATQDVTLLPEGREFRATLRFVDRPKGPGVTVYVAALEGPDGHPLPGDYQQNNVLLGALQVDGPSRWMAVARPGTSLAEWTKQNGEVLGVKMTGVEPQRLPDAPDGYAAFTGVLVGDLSAGELPDDVPALKALGTAVENGLALVALGGEQAFGAGQHPENGNWEGLLPVTFRPEDDRTRTILFVLDTSATMAGQMAGGQEQKLAYACARLSEVAQPGPTSWLRATDRVGLISFADSAELVAEPSSDPDRRMFREKLNGLRTSRQTNFLAALELARRTLAADHAEERLVIFVSDGEPTPAIPDGELEKAVLALCPGEGEKRRTRLHTFGIATGVTDRNEQGEVRLKRMAKAGGGTFFPDFLKLSNGLKQVLDDTPPEFYVRREAFTVQSPFPLHPLLSAAGPWPELTFRNRVRARPESMVLAQSAPVDSEAGARKADPLVVLGHRGLGATAVLALTLDGPAGLRFLTARDPWKGGQAFLAALLAWVEQGDPETRAGWQVETEERGGRLKIRVAVRGPDHRPPHDGRPLTARLAPVFTEAVDVRSTELLPIAPGVYEGEMDLPSREPGRTDERGAVHRLEVLREGLVARTQFISVPYPQEYRRFGTDRVTLAAWARSAGGRSRMLDVPDNLLAWLKEVEAQRAYLSARGILLVLAALGLLAEVAVRGLRRRC